MYVSGMCIVLCIYHCLPLSDMEEKSIFKNFFPIFFSIQIKLLSMSANSYNTVQINNIKSNNYSFQINTFRFIRYYLVKVKFTLYAT